MKYKEFLEYLENNLEGYHTFKSKAMQYQIGKNAKRPPKSRWNDMKMEKAVSEMWKKSMENLYNNLKHEIQSDSTACWISFIDKNGILEIVNEGISELDFSEDVA